MPDNGFWFAPTVFTGVSPAHRIAREEIFGPVLSVLTFRTPDEAVAEANNTPYGLSAGIWTEKGSRILWMADRLRAGRGVGQHVQPVRPDQPVRRVPGVRLRPRGRQARPGRLRERGVSVAGHDEVTGTTTGRDQQLTGTTAGRDEPVAGTTAGLDEPVAGTTAGLDEPVASTRVDVRKTYKLYVGGSVPAQRVRPLLRGARRHRQLPRQRGDGLPQGRP